MTSEKGLCAQKHVCTSKHLTDLQLSSCYKPCPTENLHIQNLKLFLHILPYDRNYHYEKSPCCLKDPILISVQYFLAINHIRGQLRSIVTLCLTETIFCFLQMFYIKLLRGKKGQCHKQQHRKKEIL